METRRFILALSLSLIVFLVYVRFFAPPPPETPIPAEAPQEARKAPEEKPKAPTPLTGEVARKIIPASKGKEIIIESDLVKAVVNTAGGVITGIELKQYREADKTPVGLGVLWGKITGKGQRKKNQKKNWAMFSLCLCMKRSAPGISLLH